MKHSTALQAFALALSAIGFAPDANARPVDVQLQEGETAHIKKFGFRRRRVICVSATREINGDQATFEYGLAGGRTTTLLVPGEYVMIGGLFKNDDVSCASDNLAERQQRAQERAERERREALERAANRSCEVVVRDADFVGFESRDAQRMYDYIRREKLPAAGYRVYDDSTDHLAPSDAKQFSMTLRTRRIQQSGFRADTFEVSTSASYTTSVGQRVAALTDSYAAVDSPANIESRTWDHLRALNFYACPGTPFPAPITTPSQPAPGGQHGGEGGSGGSSPGTTPSRGPR